MPGKISIRFFIYLALTAIFSTYFNFDSHAQDSVIKKPQVTSDPDIYSKQVKADSNKRMVSLHSLIPGIACDLRYSGLNNFVQRRMYPEDTREAFLRLPVAHALARAQKELVEKGLGLKVFDAYRPYSVTVKFWELIKDTRYVAHPAKGSGHNRGTAVDITIISLQDGNELNMGTGFDNFSDTAHHSFKRLPGEVLQNRLLLKTVMERNGFKALNTEWWHYIFTAGSRFELLDIDFKKLNTSLN